VSFNNDSNDANNTSCLNNACFGDTVTLTLGSDLDRNATPTVTYAFAAGGVGHSVMTDAAGNTTPSASGATTDGIAPAAPVLTLVDSKGAFSDGKWYTNDPFATFTLSNVEAGDAVTVAQEGNGVPGYQPSTDYFLCSATVARGATTASCQVGGWQFDSTKSLYLVARDASGNASPSGTAAVVLRRTPPTLADATLQAQVNTLTGAKTGSVTATFDEPIASGRDFAVDWHVDGMLNGSPVSFTVTSVSAPTSTTRTLTIDPNDPNFFACGLRVTSVSYSFQSGLTGTAYTDPAGNATTSSSTSNITGTPAC